jgi:hypothetical protein
MRVKFLIVGLLFCYGCNNSKPVITQPSNDDFYEKCRKLVLSENQQGQEYFFSKKVQGADEISITYLGNVITAKKDTLRILNSVNYSGQLADTKHGSGNVFIYDVRNTRIGFYYVGAAWAVASGVRDGNLIFSYSNEQCNQSTTISLKDSIPKQIFINCTDKGGDLYNFTNEY